MNISISCGLSNIGNTFCGIYAVEELNGLPFEFFN